MKASRPKHPAARPTPAAAPPAPSFARLVRIVRARPRLFLSALLGLAVIGVLSAATDWKVATRLLLGWDLGVALYLTLAFQLIADCDVHHIRRRAVQQDDGAIAILVLTAIAALASFGAIIAELGTAQGATRSPAQLVIATATIVLSWVFTHMTFALHYAHEFYGESGTKDRGMSFPGNDEPDYWDFFYFSIVIGMTSQVSDVAVTTRSIRRTVTAHGIVSFFFNAALLALTVNIAASAI